MKIYKVGGAVRDKLLDRKVVDHDYVVVGATVEDMLALDYTPVGKDFPVFLHPQTHEEYALARTERKVAKGYHGFEFYVAADVSLEDDLVRRDLTINAIAEDEAGNLYDPHHGIDDLNARVLRHVSPSFAEDPLRVLRVARFAARYFSYGFTIADETMAMMQCLVEHDEVDALVAERVWQEVEKALSDDNPWIFFQVLRQCGALARLLPEIEQLFGVPQSKQWHPEIDTGVHTMMVLEQAARLSNESVVRFAALLHDLGKGITPKEEWPRHIAHESRGVPLVRAVCERLKVPKNYTALALLVTEFHLNYHRIDELKNATIVDLLSRLDAFRRPQRFEHFLLACEADAKGRTGYENSSDEKTQRFRACFQAADQVNTKDIVAQGFKGQDIAEQLRIKRIAAVKVCRH
ncbi:multifunctional CCA addition/repair protein [sulfur-oxidizing endosymbiont of Gigantopelta aegis]|uniref:multifunctional CCA addition/repair protein n=1 Tax=sulfur-oxidizing endosymbiont of Gigantopelta aegis TaxID=2794934 RepID=UPI0018DC9F01|nr:multifunctional CCA addition/repair protein [sulfur-oxidizing endosymbiont of Gigantopelta aegis]